MSQLYVNESNVIVGIEGNRCYVKYIDVDFSDRKKEIPLETLEGISIIGKAQVTTQCVRECLKRGIPISYYSTKGNYYGKLQSAGHINAQRQWNMKRMILL